MSNTAAAATKDGGAVGSSRYAGEGADRATASMHAALASLVIADKGMRPARTSAPAQRR
jgi:hypothetical protein